MGMLLQIGFSIPANTSSGSRINGQIVNLGQNPTVPLNSINLTGKKITKAYVPATPSIVNLAMFIINPSGNSQILGTEAQLTMTTTFNPNIMKNILCESAGDYAFAGVCTGPAGSTALNITLMIELE